MVFITKKKMIILISSILSVLTAAGVAAALIINNNIQEESAHAIADMSAAEIALALKEEPDYGDAALNILCDTGGAKELGATEAGSIEISQQAYHRNDHFEMDTGTDLTFTVADDFLSAAREDILSGTLKYNLYAASAVSLSELITSGELRDISDSSITTAHGYDRAVTDKLSLYGQRLLISSSISDARDSITAIAYDRTKTADINIDGKTLAELAKDGQFTVENLLTACRSGENVTLYYDDTNAYALYFGTGGSFVNFSDGVLEINPYNTALESFNQVKTLSSADISSSDAENSFFTVTRLSDINAMRAEGKDIGILPLPKATVAAEYRSYIDLQYANLLAMPHGAQNTSGLDLLVSEYMSLSQSYMPSQRVSRIAAENEDDIQILSIIYAGADCDLAELFDYGDVGGMIAEMLRDDERFAINYYNRKELLEKAFSIVEKRITEELIINE